MTVLIEYLRLILRHWCLFKNSFGKIVYLNFRVNIKKWINIFVNRKSKDFQSLITRVNSANSGCLSKTGHSPLYTMMSLFAAIDRITQWWAVFTAFGSFINWRAASWSLAPLYNDGPLCDPFPIFIRLPEFSKSALLSSRYLKVPLIYSCLGGAWFCKVKYS